MNRKRNTGPGDDKIRVGEKRGLNAEGAEKRKAQARVPVPHFVEKRE